MHVCCFVYSVFMSYGQSIRWGINVRYSIFGMEIHLFCINKRFLPSDHILFVVISIQHCG